VLSDLTRAEEIRLRYAAIVESSHDAIIAKDLDGVISAWNAAAERMFGYKEHEAIGQPITLIVPPDLYDEEHDILKCLRAGERIDHYETVRITKAGERIDVSLTISPLRDPAGRIIGCSKMARDITKARQADVALRQSERRLAREVAGAKTLQSISTRLISESRPESLYAQILGAAIELMASDAASVQMLAADHTSLRLLAWTNFHPDSAAFWQRAAVGAGSTFSKALSDNERVVVADIEACEFMAGTQDQQEYRRSGIRAVQSTPLRSRTGRPLGMLSTHWRTPHTPTEDNFRFFDVLARQAADLIERTLAEEALLMQPSADDSGGVWNARQINGEDTSPFRHVPRRDLAVIRFDAPSAEREPETQASTIRAALLERSEQFAGIASGKPAAFVLNLDADALGVGVHA
jgi:PAS domain S-box-containing protein